VSGSTSDLKTDVLAAIVRALREELARQTSAAESSREEAISEESRPENKWDTHSQEAAYLAEGQARLAAEISSAVAQYQALAPRRFGPGEPVALGALVGVASSPAKLRVWYFLGPQGGGLELQVAGRQVLVVTPASPLGRELIGRRLGESVRPPGKGGAQGLMVVAVE
jgi:hypothetical protein